MRGKKRPSWLDIHVLDGDSTYMYYMNPVWHSACLHMAAYVRHVKVSFAQNHNCLSYHPYDGWACEIFSEQYHCSIAKSMSAGSCCSIQELLLEAKAMITHVVSGGTWWLNTSGWFIYIRLTTTGYLSCRGVTMVAHLPADLVSGRCYLLDE